MNPMLNLFPSLEQYLSASRTDRSTQLTDQQWLLIEDLFPWEPPSRCGGRPQAPPRACFEGILWVLVTGARWKDLPKYFPSFTTCWRRFKQWTESGLFVIAWARLLQELDRRGELDWSEGMADGTFASAKKGANALAPPNAVKEPRSCCSLMVMELR
jgi:transposase